MKMADILRDLADLIDQKMGVVDPAADNTTQQRMTPVKAVEPELDDEPLMVPPLQAKLEILKKSEGMPNVYDEAGAEEDELALMKKRAGLTAAQHVASEDNDVLG